MHIYINLVKNPHDIIIKKNTEKKIPSIIYYVYYVLKTDLFSFNVKLIT